MAAPPVSVGAVQARSIWVAPFLVAVRPVRCTVPDGGSFAGVAVELDAANRIFTTLPVVPVPERMSQE